MASPDEIRLYYQYVSDGEAIEMAAMSLPRLPWFHNRRKAMLELAETCYLAAQHIRERWEKWI